MNPRIHTLWLPAVISSVILVPAQAQDLASPLNFTASAQFRNGVAESSSSILLIDNNLTNGYASGYDGADAPTSLTPRGPAGSALFQWGQASIGSSYAHASALWFEPLSAVDVQAEQTFAVGYLYYRNGTINSNTGASAVDLALTLYFSQPTGLEPVSAIYHSILTNTANTSDPVASADIVTLRNLSSPLSFADADGNRYYLELGFEVNQSTIDGTLSTQNKFRVFEGGLGRAELLARFTTTPGTETPLSIPEPNNSALLGIGAALLIWLRKR